MDDELKTMLALVMAKIEALTLMMTTLATKDDIAGLTARADAHDGRFDAHDARFDAHDGRFDAHDARFDAQDAELEKLRTQVAVVQAGQDELRHVTSANHFRMMGRIDQLSDQLIDHIGGHARPAKPAA